MIRLTAKLTLKGVGRAYIEEMVADCTIDSSDRTECVCTLEIERDFIRLHGEKGAIKEHIEDAADDVRVMSVQVLEARCSVCYSQAPHRCECVIREGWTDDQEAA